MIKYQSIVVNVSNQTLTAMANTGESIEYSVSTAKNGVGQEFGSECTPLGIHRIRAKIGAESSINTAFIGRRPSGEIYSEEIAQQEPKRDWILTRILWLCGNEVGHNRLRSVDTMRRFIYIHGAPDTHAMGTPSSHGCIKMRNKDVIELFDRVAVGTNVNIVN